MKLSNPVLASLFVFLVAASFVAAQETTPRREPHKLLSPEEVVFPQRETTRFGVKFKKSFFKVGPSTLIFQMGHRTGDQIAIPLTPYDISTYRQDAPTCTVRATLRSMTKSRASTIANSKAKPLASLESSMETGEVYHLKLVHQGPESFQPPLTNTKISGPSFVFSLEQDEGRKAFEIGCIFPNLTAGDTINGYTLHQILGDFYDYVELAPYDVGARFKIEAKELTHSFAEQSNLMTLELRSPLGNALSQDQLSIFENGKKQKIVSFKEETKEAYGNYTFLLDASQSTFVYAGDYPKTIFTYLAIAAQHLMWRLPVNIGSISAKLFGTEIVTLTTSQERKAISNAFINVSTQKLNLGPGTRTTFWLNESMKRVPRRFGAGKNIIFLFTDGDEVLDAKANPYDPANKRTEISEASLVATATATGHRLVVIRFSGGEGGTELLSYTDKVLENVVQQTDGLFLNVKEELSQDIPQKILALIPFLQRSYVVQFTSLGANTSARQISRQVEIKRHSRGDFVVRGNRAAVVYNLGL